MKSCSTLASNAHVVVAHRAAPSALCPWPAPCQIRMCLLQTPTGAGLEHSQAIIIARQEYAQQGEVLGGGPAEEVCDEGPPAGIACGRAS